MRIQHNIMAMNAYRNYTGNVSAMQKNLEKLSSGYKINRAGDDAAGLAISEKMRAQITGLETAQKNAKDGISLVQTAEGALTEVHDMLNRMVELATQSANGTYDNDTDRAQMQKEMDQLRSEINRIADSSNFNGIKLFDGSMDPTTTGIGATDAVEGTTTSFVSSSVGETLGTDTVQHKGGGTAKGTQFGVDLHEVAFENKNGQTLELTIGTDKFTLAGGDHTGAAGANKPLTAKEIVDAFVAGKFKKADGSAMTASEATVNGTDFTVSANNGTGIKFVMKDGGTPIQGDMNVSVAAKAADAPDVTGLTAAPTTTGNDDATGKTKIAYDFNGITGLTAGNYDVTIGGQKVTVTLAEGATAASDLADAVRNALTAPADGIGDDTKYTVGGTGTAVEFEASGNDVIATDKLVTGDITVAANTEGVSGDYNVTTTITDSGSAAGDRRIASAVATLNASTFADGNTIRIGDKTYTVSTKAEDKGTGAGAPGKIYVGDLTLTNAADLKKAIDRLSVQTADNSVWTVGHGTTAGQVTFTEKVDASNKSYTELQTGSDGKLKEGAFDLSKEEDIKKSLGTVTGMKAATAGKNGKQLVLQIGDTAEDFNQLKVTMKDMHVDHIGKALKADGITVDNSVTNGNLSIDDISIADQDSAAIAVAVIKRAINQVSDMRGTLGATQNRLDHTINNLSVMTENIQDAESSIRDVDVAEEMMAYTKNNILIQSAQAMLAQANQVPQGVLQLLQ